jgi:hypothetical protein
MATLFVFAGGFLMLVCGSLVFIRLYRLKHRWGRTPEGDSLGRLFETIRLRNTIVIEVIGLIVGAIVMQAAMSELGIASR